MAGSSATGRCFVTLQASDIALIVASMGRHHFEHDNGRGWTGIVDTAQLVIALAAVGVAVAAFAFTRREGIRAGNRERLRWMHEALNQLEPLQGHALATPPHARKYEELQQWLKTSLAVAGARERLPLTMALADRSIPDNPDDPVQRTEMVDAVDGARAELLEALEKDGGLAAAGKRLK
jgi:hypothetical protein